MQRKQVFAGVACAVLAAGAVFAYTATISSEAQVKRQAALDSYGGEQVQVVIASKAIGAGEKVAQNNTKTVTWLTDLLPQTEVAQSSDQVEGQIAEVDIKEGEPITLDRIGDGSARINVPSGLEAVSVSSDDVLAVGGAIQAGSFVDVYMETSASKVVLLGQKILVLETSAATSKNDSKAVTWVTLAVTPDSVSQLLGASVKGTIHLTLPGGQAEEEE